MTASDVELHAATASDVELHAAAGSEPLWPDWRLVLRIGAPLAYLTAASIYLARTGFSLSRDHLLILVAGLLLAASITNPRHWLRSIVFEWLPFAAILFAYDALRGIADGLVMPAQALPQLRADEWLFGGSAPTVWLQAHLWGGAGHLGWWDYASWGVYVTHFLAPLTLAAALWIFAHHRFRRYVVMVCALALAGFATYALFPAVPPWMAAQQHLLGHVDRIVPIAWGHIHVFSFDTLFQQGAVYANDVAAMPSLHAAYSLLVVLVLWGLTRRRWLRAVLALYPPAMGFALVYSGEHYVVDVLAGWVYAGAVFALVTHVAERRARRAQAVAESPPALR